MPETTFFEMLSQHWVPLLSGGAAGAIITAIVTAVRESKKKSKIQVIENFYLNPFSLPESIVKDSDRVYIAYVGRQVKDLKVYLAEIRNIGQVDIDEVSLVFRVPKASTVLEVSINTLPITLQSTLTEKSDPNVFERNVIVNKFCPNDTVSVYFLFDDKASVNVEFMARGVDIVRGRGPSSYFSKLQDLIFVFLILLSGTILLWGLGTAGVTASALLIAIFSRPISKLITDILREYTSSKLGSASFQRDALINIVDNSGIIHVGQKEMPVPPKIRK
jgi:hypothetical protein